MMRMMERELVNRNMDDETHWNGCKLVVAFISSLTFGLAAQDIRRGHDARGLLSDRTSLCIHSDVRSERGSFRPLINILVHEVRRDGRARSIACSLRDYVHAECCLEDGFPHGFVLVILPDERVLMLQAFGPEGYALLECCNDKRCTRDVVWLLDDSA